MIILDGAFTNIDDNIIEDQIHSLEYNNIDEIKKIIKVPGYCKNNAPNTFKYGEFTFTKIDSKEELRMLLQFSTDKKIEFIQNNDFLSSAEKEKSIIIFNERRAQIEDFVNSSIVNYKITTKNESIMVITLYRWENAITAATIDLFPILSKFPPPLIWFKITSLYIANILYNFNTFAITDICYFKYNTIANHYNLDYDYYNREKIVNSIRTKAIRQRKYREQTILSDEHVYTISKFKETYPTLDNFVKVLLEMN